MPQAWKTYVERCCYGNRFTYRLHYSCCNNSFMESLHFCIVPAVSLTPRSQQPSSNFYGISNPDDLSARVAKGQHNLVKAGTPRGVPFSSRELQDLVVRRRRTGRGNQGYHRQHFGILSDKYCGVLTSTRAISSLWIELMRCWFQRPSILPCLCL